MKLAKTAPLKVILSILVFSSLAFVGVRLRRSFTQIHSAQAFINGEIIFVRASIPGKLELKSDKIKLSKQLKKGTQIGTIKSTVENPQVSSLKIDKQQLKTRLQDVQQQIAGVKQQIRSRNRLMNLFKQQAVTQKMLQVRYAQQQIKQLEEEIVREQAREKVKLADAQRFAFLAGEGAETVSRAENQIAEAQQASAVVKEAQSKTQLAKLQLEATKAGLQLEGTRTLSYPETRVLELDIELIDLK